MNNVLHLFITCRRRGFNLDEGNSMPDTKLFFFLHRWLIDLYAPSVFFRNDWLIAMPDLEVMLIRILWQKLKRQKVSDIDRVETLFCSYTTHYLSMIKESRGKKCGITYHAKVVDDVMQWRFGGQWPYWTYSKLQQCFLSKFSSRLCQLCLKEHPKGHRVEQVMARKEKGQISKFRNCM